MGEYDFSRWRREDLVSRLHEIEKEEARLRGEKLALVAEIDKIEAFRFDGAPSTTSWLAAELRQSTGSAKDLVEVATAFEALPEIAAAHASGEISFDVASELAKFATPEKDKELAREAATWSVTTARRAARRAREISIADKNDALQARHLNWWWESSGLLLHLKGALPAAEGAALVALLEEKMKSLPSYVAGDFVSHTKRRSDALSEIVAAAGSGKGGRSRPELVLHMDLEDFINNRGAAEAGEGYLPPEIARRLACDSRLSFVLEDSSGSAVGISSSCRSVPSHIDRVIRDRDKVCIFPGCERVDGTEIHHIVHVADGGETKTSNLCLICKFHHKLCHDFGWKMTGSAKDGLEVAAPNGRRLQIPPLVREKLRA